MKRVISACLEQTQKFETDRDFQTYLSDLDRNKVKYKIVDKQVGSDSTVTVKLIREYNDYSVGDYMD